MGHTLLHHEGIFHVHTYYHDGDDGGPDGDGGDEENGGHQGVCCGSHLRKGEEAVVVGVRKDDQGEVVEVGVGVGVCNREAAASHDETLYFCAENATQELWVPTRSCPSHPRYSLQQRPGASPTRHPRHPTKTRRSCCHLCHSKR